MADEVEKVAEAAEEKTGLIYASLGRSNKQIREERGDALADQLETSFRRNIEDLRYDIKDLKRKRNNMYDFSPTNANSLVMAKDVEARNILVEDMEKSIDIENKELKLKIAEKRYFELFGKHLAE